VHLVLLCFEFQSVNFEFTAVWWESARLGIFQAPSNRKHPPIVTKEEHIEMADAFDVEAYLEEQTAKAR
jgi:hypothetical protein